jgi:hypothetical protein
MLATGIAGMIAFLWRDEKDRAVENDDDVDSLLG